MPSLREHCLLTEQRYGVTGMDIHKWMDEPVKLFGPTHRLVRHDKYQELPKQFIEAYGSDLAYNIMLDHLLADEQTPDGLPKQIQRRRRKAQALLPNISDTVEIEQVENVECSIIEAQTSLTPEQHTTSHDIPLSVNSSWSEILDELNREIANRQTIRKKIAELENRGNTSEC